MDPHQKKKKSRKKLLLTVVIVIAFVLVSGVIIKKIIDSRTKLSTNDGQVIDLKPATEEERQQAEDNKQAIIDNEARINSGTSTPDGKHQVNPVITSVSLSGLIGYVNGVFEEGGTCRADFRMGNLSFSKSSQGFENASYTQCAPIALSSSDFPGSGSWTVSLTYISPTSEGSSPTQVLEVSR